MKNLFILLLVTVFGSHALQHNLFYGSCVYDNNTVPIYTQVISLDNPHPIVATTPKPTRGWFNWLPNLSFRRRSPSPPVTQGTVINTTVVFPPAVSHWAFVAWTLTVASDSWFHSNLASIWIDWHIRNADINTQRAIRLRVFTVSNSTVLTFLYYIPCFIAVFFSEDFLI